jgi:hypothetical protein
VDARCHGASCGLTAQTRLRSRREAILIGWPILSGWVTDPSLSAVRRATLGLSDTRTGARLTFSCRFAYPRTIPTGQASVAALSHQCATVWRSSY